MVRGRRGKALGRRVTRAGLPATRGKEEETRKGSPGLLKGGSAERRGAATRPPRSREEREERARPGGAGRGQLQAGIPSRVRRRRGPARSDGPGPSRAPSRLTQWPRHAGWACTCSKRLLADMALGSSLGTTAADSSSGRRQRRMSPGGGSRGCGGGFCP